MRLIDADAFEVVTAQNVSDDFVEGAQYVLEMIDNAPTVDAEPVRHGMWVGRNNEDATTLKCSICGVWQPVYAHKHWRYCPNCGTRMDEKENFHYDY